MLTDQDIQFINNNRMQLEQGRTTPVIVGYSIAAGFDVWTGESAVSTVEIPVQAIVTETADADDLQINDGITENRSSIQVGISIEQLEGYASERPSYLVYDGCKYAIRSVDREGVGAFHNRLEIKADRTVN